MEATKRQLHKVFENQNSTRVLFFKEVMKFSTFIFLRFAGGARQFDLEATSFFFDSRQRTTTATALCTSKEAVISLQLLC